MNPVVLIASHERIEITEINIRTLLLQSVVPRIVLVLSKPQEAAYFRSAFKSDITIVLKANQPLGAKWQAGVEAARNINADPLIITGSDDILSVGFIKLACVGMKEHYDFLGLREWYVKRPIEDKVYHFRYGNFMPLGGGRVYSLPLLCKLNYNLFDTIKEKHLDDLGWIGTQERGTFISDDCAGSGLAILSIKGDWPTMNPFDKMLGHKNAKLIDTITPSKEFLKDNFNYEIS